LDESLHTLLSWSEGRVGKPAFRRRNWRKDSRTAKRLRGEKKSFDWGGVVHGRSIRQNGSSYTQGKGCTTGTSHQYLLTKKKGENKKSRKTGVWGEIS